MNIENIKQTYKKEISILNNYTSDEILKAFSSFQKNKKSKGKELFALFEETKNKNPINYINIIQLLIVIKILEETKKQ